MPHRSWSMFLILFGSARASLPLPHGLEWRRIDDRQVGTTVRSLLHSSYVATPEEDLRLDYSASALQWMLCAPGAIDELRVAIAEPDDFSIVAFVCCAMRIRARRRREAKCGGGPLLCVRHDWRGKGLTRLLLAELRRRAAEKGIATAIYTAAEPRHRDRFAVLTTCSLHRPLRPLDLLRCGFWQPPDERTCPHRHGVGAPYCAQLYRKLGGFPHLRHCSMKLAAATVGHALSQRGVSERCAREMRHGAAGCSWRVQPISLFLRRFLPSSSATASLAGARIRLFYVHLGVVAARRVARRAARRVARAACRWMDCMDGSRSL